MTYNETYDKVLDLIDEHTDYGGFVDRHDLTKAIVALIPTQERGEWTDLVNTFGEDWP